MKTILPHEYFRLDFDQILEEGRRQENIHSANQGEFKIVEAMHRFFVDVVMSLIIHNDWVFDAASRFASEYAMDCFDQLRLGGKEIFEAQNRLLEVNNQVVDFLGNAHNEGVAPLAGSVDLAKASDFILLLDVDQLRPVVREEADLLRQKALEIERLQVNITLRGVRDYYEITLPRILYVVRRAIKVHKKLKPKQSDNNLIGLSESIDWYEKYIDNQHPLYPVLGEIRGYYRIARNVASHHSGLGWDFTNNQVTLKDDKDSIQVHIYTFQQKFRYLTHLCELGVRGISAAFCERDKGDRANSLIEAYLKTFPWKPSTENLKLYP